MSEENNPFLKLFGSSNPQNNSTVGNSSCTIQQGKVTPAPGITRIAEDVFGIAFSLDNESIRTGRVLQLVYIEEIAPALVSQDFDALKLAVFERICLCSIDSSNLLISNHPSRKIVAKNDSHVCQKHNLLYLYHCFCRLQDFPQSKDSLLDSDTLKKVTNFVIEYFSTALRQPELFENQQVHSQVITLYKDEDIPSVTNFLNLVVEFILVDDNKDGVFEAFRPLFDLLKEELSASKLLTYPTSHLAILESFASIPTLAEFLVHFSMPINNGNIRGVDYENTLFGSILNLSSLPKSSSAQVEYFERPLDGALSALDNSLWSAQRYLCDKLYSIFDQILRSSPTNRKGLLGWIIGCLEANLPRARLWPSTAPLNFEVGYVSDGFALNLGSVLLCLSQPFLNDHTKLLKIDPTFSAYKAPEGEGGGELCLRSLAQETCLQPSESTDPKPHSAPPFSFITVCFFLTHRCLDIGARVVLDRTQQLYQEIGRLQRALNNRTAGYPENLLASLRENMESEMSRFLCMRSALLEPTLLRNLSLFQSGTSIWLLQVVLDSEDRDRTSMAPMLTRPLTFPLPESSSPALRYIPELLVESVCWYLKLVKAYSTQSLEEGGSQLLEPLLSLLLVMMSSKARVRNPHLRAQLAQSLECLLPRDEGQLPSLDPNPYGTFYRERLFSDHPHKEQIVPCLLHVFVSIEMTGEGVAFEQKFNYRRPMYAIMDFLWGLDQHRVVFKQLASDAEERMEEVSPPLFLVFLNLLINDAIFLLDEALSNMALLRTLQTARDGGEWEAMPREERERNERTFSQTGMIARFDNILGKETIHALEYMSSEIKSIFCHPMLVERITAMLNYFLFNLVGPDKKKLKVKDHEDYMFKPALIVKDICSIYIHLGSSTQFNSAVSRDGRSYSPQLFKLARDVLARIGGGPQLISELDAVAEEVARLAALHETDEELLSEAPEEFLDPIMSTLMLDPVTLPSSKVNIDRSTIARHLLSDQTDPFNRSPLTMDMLITNSQLKTRIEAWISERRNQSPSTST